MRAEDGCRSRACVFLLCDFACATLAGIGCSKASSQAHVDAALDVRDALGAWLWNTDALVAGKGHCGNSVIDSGEDCDDGNTKDGDGRASDCHVETGWDCLADSAIEEPLHSSRPCVLRGDVRVVAPRFVDRRPPGPVHLHPAERQHEHAECEQAIYPTTQRREHRLSIYLVPRWREHVEAEA